MPEPIVIAEYDSEWPARFEAAHAGISEAAGRWLVSIEHVASTAVPGLAAKRIIDIMPGLRHFDDGHQCVAPLGELGYEYRGEYGVAGRHYFVKSNAQGSRDQHVHMVVAGSDFWTRHLLFRDYLRVHSFVAREYGRLKYALARRYPGNRMAYLDGKSQFVESVLWRAQLLAPAVRARITQKVNP